MEGEVKGEVYASLHHISESFGTDGRCKSPLLPQEYFTPLPPSSPPILWFLLLDAE